MTSRRFWDVTIVWCCATNVQGYLFKPIDDWGWWGWFIVVTGFTLIAGKYFQRNAF